MLKMDMANISNWLIGPQIATTKHQRIQNVVSRKNSDLANNKKKTRCTQSWSYDRDTLIADFSIPSATEKRTF